MATRQQWNVGMTDEERAMVQALAEADHRTSEADAVRAAVVGTYKSALKDGKISPANQRYVAGVASGKTELRRKEAAKSEKKKPKKRE